MGGFYILNNVRTMDLEKWERLNKEYNLNNFDLRVKGVGILEMGTPLLPVMEKWDPFNA
jgi:hypothetical protein